MLLMQCCCWCTVAEDALMPLLRCCCADATQVLMLLMHWWPTLEAIKLAPADDQILQVVPLGDSICKCKWCLIVAKFAISASSSIWWPKCVNNGWGIICWQNFLLANGRWRHLVAKFATNSSGPKSDWTYAVINWFTESKVWLTYTVV